MSGMQAREKHKKTTQSTMEASRAVRGNGIAMPPAISRTMRHPPVTTPKGRPQICVSVCQVSASCHISAMTPYSIAEAPNTIRAYTPVFIQEIQPALTSISCATSVSERFSLTTTKSCKRERSRQAFNSATRETYSRCERPVSRILTRDSIVLTLAVRRHTDVSAAETIRRHMSNSQRSSSARASSNSSHSKGSVIIPNSSKIAIHDRIVATGCGQESKSQCVHIDRGMRHALESQEV